MVGGEGDIELSAPISKLPTWRATRQRTVCKESLRPSTSVYSPWYRTTVSCVLLLVANVRENSASLSIDEAQHRKAAPRRVPHMHARVSAGAMAFSYAF